MKKSRYDDIAFEDSIGDDWSRDFKVIEVPIGNRPLLYLGAVVFAVALAIAGQILYLNLARGQYYRTRAADNVAQANETPAPRGEIFDREGGVLAEDKAAFAAVLNARAFMDAGAIGAGNTGAAGTTTGQDLQAATIDAAQNILGISSEAFAALIDQASTNDFATQIVLNENLTQNQLVNLQALDLPTIQVQNDFARAYPNGPIFSSVVGYTGRVTQSDLQKNADLSAADIVGKAGLEAYYDSALRGVPGITLQYKNARGQVVGQAEKSSGQTGPPLRTTIDGGLQTYFYDRLAGGLRSLGRTIGLGLAINPQTGEILALVNLPGYDNNVFSPSAATGTGIGATAIIKNLLTSSDKPLFNRAVAGYYNPGSTIKPLDAVAALKEGVIDPSRQIFSPGYLLVPNPYNSSTPTRFLDWRYQGNVNLAAALAQSSDVYFYIVGGGSPANNAQSTRMLNDASDYGISGLGITRLNQWWQMFGLGKPTGVDMPGEAYGFLPTPGWKQSKFGTPWLLGDTYNVSIGQGDLLVSPLQLLSYIAAIANGGEIYRPYLNASSTAHVNEDLTSLAPEIAQVQIGMRAGVASPQGTSYSLHDLPFCVGAKTGSAQVHDNSQENALFVGYAPCGGPAAAGGGAAGAGGAPQGGAPQIAILILIENSKQGSLNAVPIAKDVLNWYYKNRLAPAASQNR